MSKYTGVTSGFVHISPSRTAQAHDWEMATINDELQIRNRLEISNLKFATPLARAAEREGDRQRASVKK